MANKLNSHFETKPRRLVRPKSSMDVSVFDRLFKGTKGIKGYKGRKTETPSTLPSHSRTKSAGKAKTLQINPKPSYARAHTDRVVDENTILKELRVSSINLPRSALRSEGSTPRNTHNIGFAVPAAAKGNEGKLKLSLTLKPVLENYASKSNESQTTSATARVIKTTHQNEGIMSHCHVKLLPRSSSALCNYTLDENKEKVEGLKALRDLLATTYKVDVQEPPDLLNLNFCHWEEKRQMNSVAQKKISSKPLLVQANYR